MSFFLPSSSLLGVCELLLAALLWGTTNPALKAASGEKTEKATHDGTSTSPNSSKASPSSSSPSLVSLLLNWRFLLPFLLNQSGSIFYLHSLATVGVSFAVPTCNALTMVITGISGRWYGEKQRMNKRIMTGMILILIGVSICIMAQHQQDEETKQQQMGVK